MTFPAWHEEPIAKSHDRKAFDCGDDALNTFLLRYARQGHEQNAVKTYCAVANDPPNGFSASTALRRRLSRTTSCRRS